MRCAVCQADNRGGARFCGGCGVHLAPSCAKCGAALKAGARFCGECGEAATEAGAPPEALESAATVMDLAPLVLCERCGAPLRGGECLNCVVGPSAAAQTPTSALPTRATPTKKGTGPRPLLWVVPLLIIASVGGYFAYRALVSDSALVAPGLPTREPAEARGSATATTTLLALAPSDAGVTAAPLLVPGVAWLGREWLGSGWDFVAVASEAMADRAIRYRFEASPVRGAGQRRGVLEVRLVGRRLRAVLRMPDRPTARIYDATTILAEGRAFAIGDAWDEDEPRVRAPFWATLERVIPQGPQRVALNQASVAQLEALGLSPRSARTIAEGRIVWRPYKSVDEAVGAPDLTVAEREVLRAQTFVP